MASGVNVSPVFTSWSTAWRCENVPRSTSWPVSRTLVPSTSSDANASDSAWPQSMAPALIASRRFGRVRAIVSCSLNVDGQLSNCSLSATSRSDRTAVSASTGSGAATAGSALLSASPFFFIS